MNKLAVIAVLLLALGIPVLLIWLAVKLCLSRKRWIRWLAIIPTSVLAYLSYQVYVAFYPREEFYREVWVVNTRSEMPASAEFRSKEATYPDQHGDYWAGAVIEVSGSDFDEVERRLRSTALFSVDTSDQPIGISGEFRALTKGLNMSDVRTVYRNDSTEWFRVALFKDGRTIVFERSSS